MNRQRSLNWGCAYIFWFDKRIPKDIKALTSQSFAATDNMLHCFSLLPAESAGRIPFKQAHGKYDTYTE
jgi:hypothetical protein